MQDPFLFKKISEGIETICKQQGIKKLDTLELVVNEDISINSNTLKNDLDEHMPSFMKKSTKVIVSQDQIGGMKAIIKNVQGK
jgi:hypothetical protein